MAHKKAGGSSRNGRDSAGRRLGVKKYFLITKQAEKQVVKNQIMIGIIFLVY